MGAASADADGHLCCHFVLLQFIHSLLFFLLLPFHDNDDRKGRKHTDAFLYSSSHLLFAQAISAQAAKVHQCTNISIDYGALLQDDGTLLLLSGLNDVQRQALEASRLHLHISQFSATK